MPINATDQPKTPATQNSPVHKQELNTPKPAKGSHKAANTTAEKSTSSTFHTASGSYNLSAANTSRDIKGKAVLTSFQQTQPRSQDQSNLAHQSPTSRTFRVSAEVHATLPQVQNLDSATSYDSGSNTESESFYSANEQEVVRKNSTQNNALKKSSSLDSLTARKTSQSAETIFQDSHNQSTSMLNLSDSASNSSNGSPTLTSDPAKSPTNGLPMESEASATQEQYTASTTPTSNATTSPHSHYTSVSSIDSDVFSRDHWSDAFPDQPNPYESQARRLTRQSSSSTLMSAHQPHPSRLEYISEEASASSFPEVSDLDEASSSARRTFSLTGTATIEDVDSDEEVFQPHSFNNNTPNRSLPLATQSTKAVYSTDDESPSSGSSSERRRKVKRSKNKRSSPTTAQRAAAQTQLLASRQHKNHPTNVVPQDATRTNQQNQPQPARNAPTSKASTTARPLLHGNLPSQSAKDKIAQEAKQIQDAILQQQQQQQQQQEQRPVHSTPAAKQQSTPKIPTATLPGRQQTTTGARNKISKELAAILQEHSAAKANTRTTNTANTSTTTSIPSIPTANTTFDPEAASTVLLNTADANNFDLSSTDDTDSEAELTALKARQGHVATDPNSGFQYASYTRTSSSKLRV